MAYFLVPALLFLGGLHYHFFGFVAISLCLICIWLFIIGEAFFTARGKKEFVLKRYNKWYIYLLIILLMLGTYIIPSGFIASITGEVLGFKAYKMPTASMEPTITVGDYIITDSKYFKKNEPQRGDLVIIQSPKEPTKDFVKRIIALEGEKIEIRNKQVYINDEAIQERYKVHKDIHVVEPMRDSFVPELIPPSHCFVLGDNRENSMDSRFWGSIPISNIKGKPLYIYWARDKKRIGKK